MKRLLSPVRLISIIETARPSDRWLLRGMLAALAIALVWFLITLNDSASILDVRRGGTLHEGIVGTPRFVNPVLALTRADRDVTEIVYSGLLGLQASGTITTDLAAGWTTSTDGTVYTVTLKDNIFFHDGIPVTATDVVYTIELIQNEELKSPLRSNWSGVTVSATDDKTIEFTLSEPYTPFLYNLTVGILPAHIWRAIPVEQVPFSSYNTTPIGSGPYSISDTTFNNNGTVEHYELTRNEQHTPVGLLETVELSFFNDERALLAAWNSGDINATTHLSGTEIKRLQEGGDETTVLETPLTRTFVLFFNQNRNDLLRDSAVREALDLALDRNTLINDSIAGAGIPIYSIAGTEDSALQSVDVHETDTESPLDIAALVLQEAGWNRNESGSWELVDGTDVTPLTITIKTSNSPLFSNALSSISDQWEDFGVEVITEQYEQSDLLQSVVRDRDFTALLFGIDAGAANDLYPFWHSSQQNDPGLNLAQYANVTVDEALEITRASRDPDVIATANATINTIVLEERPTLQLFRPTLQYLTRGDLTPELPAQLGHPADRFHLITRWHANTREVWPIFTENDTEATLHTDE